LPGSHFAAIIFLRTSAAALARSPSHPNDYSGLIEQICRQYAGAQIGMPADLMFNQCMS
jgi:hypothetical protein